MDNKTIDAIAMKIAKMMAWTYETPMPLYLEIEQLAQLEFRNLDKQQLSSEKDRYFTRFIFAEAEEYRRAREYRSVIEQVKQGPLRP